MGGGYGGYPPKVASNGGNGGGGRAGTSSPTYNPGTGTLGSATYGGFAGMRGGSSSGGGGGGAGGLGTAGSGGSGGFGGLGKTITIGGLTNTYGAGGSARYDANSKAASGIGYGGNVLNTNSRISGTNGIVIVSVTTSLIRSANVDNPAGLICSIHDSSSDIVNTNSDWAYSLSSTAGTSSTTDYYTSGANVFNLFNANS